MKQKRTPRLCSPDAGRRTGKSRSDFDRVFETIKTAHRESRISEADARVLLSTLAGQYVAFLIESDFETKMADWSDSYFGFPSWY